MFLDFKIQGLFISKVNVKFVSELCYKQAGNLITFTGATVISGKLRLFGIHFQLFINTFI